VCLRGGAGDAGMTVKKETVLVVDDDIYILRLMQRILEAEGCRVLTAGDGKTALGVFKDETPDVVLLDVMMPGMDGYTVCQRIREFSQVPVIMVTVKSSPREKVEGLDAGADDYVTKPFAPRELVARVRAVLRRAGLWEERSKPLSRFGDLEIDFARHRVTLGVREVNPTATEYALLSCLARNAGRVLTPDQILEKVWGEGYVGKSHLLQVNITRLRKKLGDDAQKPRYIFTRPGIGYTMAEEA